jgi:hypothetical protein
MFSFPGIVNGAALVFALLLACERHEMLQLVSELFRLVNENQYSLMIPDDLQQTRK